MAIDSDRVGRRIVILKTSFPRIDIPLLFIKRPRTFLQDEDDLLESAQQVSPAFPSPEERTTLP